LRNFSLSRVAASEKMNTAAGATKTPNHLARGFRLTEELALSCDRQAHCYSMDDLTRHEHPYVRARQRALMKYLLSNYLLLSNLPFTI
jgi:hypothetical protein